MSRTTTVEHYALAVRKCGEGIDIYLEDVVWTMQYCGWKTKSSPRDNFSGTSIHGSTSTADTLRRHPEDSLGIHFTKSFTGL